MLAGDTFVAPPDLSDPVASAAVPVRFRVGGADRYCAAGSTQIGLAIAIAIRPRSTR